MGGGGGEGEGCATTLSRCWGSATARRCHTPLHHTVLLVLGAHGGDAAHPALWPCGGECQWQHPCLRPGRGPYRPLRKWPLRHRRRLYAAVETESTGAGTGSPGIVVPAPRHACVTSHSSNLRALSPAPPSAPGGAKSFRRWSRSACAALARGARASSLPPGAGRAAGCGQGTSARHHRTARTVCVAARRR